MKKLLFLLAAMAIIFTQQGCIKSCDVDPGANQSTLYKAIVDVSIDKSKSTLTVKNKAAETIELSNLYIGPYNTASLQSIKISFSNNSLIGGGIAKATLVDKNGDKLDFNNLPYEYGFYFTFFRKKCNYEMEAQGQLE